MYFPADDIISSNIVEANKIWINQRNRLDDNLKYAKNNIRLW